jgi:hypothetical protein
VITTQYVIHHNPKTIQQPNICHTQAVNTVTIPVNLHPSQLLQDQTSLSLATSHPVKHAYSHVLFHLHHHFTTTNRWSPIETNTPDQVGLPPKEFFSRIQTQIRGHNPAHTTVLPYSETRAQSTIRTTVISNNRLTEGHRTSPKSRRQQLPNISEVRSGTSPKPTK